jgi:hypothetical protein
MTPYLDNRCHKLRLVSRRTTLQDLRVLHKHAHRLTLCYMAEHKLICLSLVLVARAKTSLTFDFNVKIDVLADVNVKIDVLADPATPFAFRLLFRHENRRLIRCQIWMSPVRCVPSNIALAQISPIPGGRLAYSRRKLSLVLYSL